MDSTSLKELLAFDLAEASRPEHDPWLRVARGELTPREAVAERREHDEEADEDTLHRQALLYAPPSPEERQRDLDALRARFFAEDDGEVVDLRARRQRRWRIALGTGLAVAAAVVLAWAVLPRGPGEPGEPLPGFAPEWSNQYTGPMRAIETPHGCQRYRSDGRLVVQLRPEVALADDLVVAALARRGDRPPRPLAIEPTLSPAGVITIVEPVDTLGLAPGRWTLSFFISRREHFSARELAELSEAEHPEIAVVHSEICIER